MYQLKIIEHAALLENGGSQQGTAPHGPSDRPMWWMPTEPTRSFQTKKIPELLEELKTATQRCMSARC